MHPFFKIAVGIFAIVGAWTSFAWFSDLSSTGKIVAIGLTIGLAAFVGWLHDRGTTIRDARVEEENERIRQALERGEYDWQNDDRPEGLRSSL